MKRVLLTIICVFAIGMIEAQDFEKGGNYIHLGYGVDPWGHRGNGIGNAWGTYKKSAIGPIVIGYERGVTDVLGIGRIGAGGIFSQTFYTQKYQLGGIEDIYRSSRFAIIARAAYHFEFDVPGMDVYAGVGGGVYIYTDKDILYAPSHPSANPSGYVTYTDSRLGGGHYVFAGIRYYFASAFGVYAEVGHGHSLLNGGIVFAF